MLAFEPSPTIASYAFEPHDQIIVNGISYRPLERRPDGYIFLRADSSQAAEFFDRGKIAHLIEKGKLSHKIGAYLPEGARRHQACGTALVSTAADEVTSRAKRRHAYAEAFLELEARGKVIRTDTAIRAAMPELRDRVAEILRLADYAVVKDKNVEVLPAKVSASSVRRWLKSYEKRGMEGFHDALNRSGRRGRRIGLEELALMGPIVAGYARTKTTQKTIIDNVEIAFETENAARERDGKTLLELPSRGTVRDAIGRLDPYQVYIAQNGEAAARKQFAPVGRGLMLTRPLERVEMDEWTIDLISLFAEGGLFDHLTPEEKKLLGFNKKTIRWVVTVAICTTTRCIVAMKLSRSASAQSAIQTIDMSLRDKGVWADAFSALSPWNMAGLPELIVTDCGSAFISYETRAAMADLAIRAERTPAGLPEMRARIERFFLTAIMSLLPRLTGRTFSDIVEKGDENPEAKAALTTEDLSEALVRWVVDIYHNSPHEGLSLETPLNCWNRLIEEYGVRPAPEMRTRRQVFGTRMNRAVSKKGIRVLGVWYHDEPLTRWWIHSGANEVQVRWYQEDIGAIEVKLGDKWVELPATLEDVKGVRAETWVATVKHLRASFQRESELARPIVRQAIRDIEALNATAMKRQGLVVQDWSPENLQKIEDRLMIGFDVATEEEYYPRDSGVATSEMGLSLPTAGALEATRFVPPGNDHQEIFSAEEIPAQPSAQAPIGVPAPPDDDDSWTNESK